MKHPLHAPMLKLYEQALDHAAAHNADLDAKKPDLMTQASAALDALLKPLFT